MDDNQWRQHDIMGIIIMELHSSWKWVVLIELQLSYNWVLMSCIVYMMSCNSTIHATCPLALTAYKYSELQG